MAISDSQIDKPQRGRPKRAALPDVNINTGVQNINTKRASSRKNLPFPPWGLCLQFINHHDSRMTGILFGCRSNGTGS